MAYKLVWSAEAEADFRSIILYLKDTWSVQSSERFGQSVYLYKLDRKNALFFCLEENYLILLSIYPYTKDITRSRFY